MSIIDEFDYLKTSGWNNLTHKQQQYIEMYYSYCFVPNGISWSTIEEFQKELKNTYFYLATPGIGGLFVGINNKAELFDIDRLTDSHLSKDEIKIFAREIELFSLDCKLNHSLDLLLDNDIFNEIKNYTVAINKTKQELDNCLVFDQKAFDQLFGSKHSYEFIKNNLFDINSNLTFNMKFSYSISVPKEISKKWIK